MKTIFGRLFATFAIFSLFLLISTAATLAKEEKTSTPAAKTKIEYVLPYPGILPDHSLYPLKMLRDRILGWFTADPFKKAEYNLLLADKRLNSGLFLWEKGKIDLAEETFSKGEKYLEQALDEVERAKKTGKDTNALMSRLSLATLKHQEVLNEVLAKAPGPAKEGLKNSLQNAQKAIERVRKAQEKKLEQRLQERKLGKRPSQLFKPAEAKTR